jgi:hypothetical protein
MIEVIGSLKIVHGRVGLQSGPMRKGEERRVSTLVASTRPLYSTCAQAENIRRLTPQILTCILA